MGAHRTPPYSPVLQRGNPLARRLLHAAIFSQKGYRKDAVVDDFVGRDSRTNRQGRAANGVSFLYQSTPFGRSFRGSVGVTEILKWADANNEFDTSRGITAFVALKPLSIDQPVVAVAYSKRDTSGGAAAAGWEIQTTTAPSPDTWNVQIADGATLVGVSSVTGLSLTREDIVCFRVDPERTALSIWVNGVKETTTATAVVPGNNAFDLRSFNTFEGFINCCALWNRPISDAEIRSLYTDPYRLWRPMPWRSKFTEGIGSAAKSNFFLTF